MSRHEPSKSWNPVTRFSHCYCDKITVHKPRRWLERLLLRILPHFDIIKTANGETTLYLRRFYIWRSRWIGLNLGEIYIHHIVRSDDDQDPHDHPWNFWTWVLSGGYTDEVWFWKRKYGARSAYRTHPIHNQIRPRQFLYRRMHHIHRVRLNYDAFGGEAPAWTLVVTGPYKREWDFVTATGPVFWRKYLDVWDDNGA